MNELTPLTSIHLSIPVDYTFLLHWVRRVNQREIIGDLGTRLTSPRQATVKVSVHGNFRLLKSDGRKRLRVYRTPTSNPTIEVEATAPRPLPTDTDPVLNTVLQKAGVRDAIYHQVPKYLESRYTRYCEEVFAKDSQEECLLDLSFADTAKGLAAWSRASQGDFTTIFRSGLGSECRSGRLSVAFPEGVHLELYLPRLDKKDWKSPATAIERSPVRGNIADGQIFVGWPEHRVIENILCLAGFAAASNTGSISQAMVSHAARQIPLVHLTSWFDAPGDREKTYTPAYGQISLAVQRFLRQELPRLWFSKPERYARIADSHAMLAYKCSRPFLGRTRTELTYEFQNPDSMRRFYKTANIALPADLERIQKILNGAAPARHYQRIFSRDIIQTVAARRRNLDRLMSAESAIIECFIEFGRAGHEFRRQMSIHPEHTAEGISRYAADFAKVLTYRTRRIHPTLDCGRLALPLLMEASTALNGVVRGLLPFRRRRAA